MFYSRLISCAFLFLCLFFANSITAASAKFYTSNPQNIMLDGFDVVTYYTYPKPMKGNDAHELQYQGVKWHFINEVNRNRFKRNPEMFIPEFGGYCVWAIAHGRLTGGKPQLWKLVDGKLYFFCTESAMSKWMDQRELINRLAFENWPEILDQ